MDRTAPRGSGGPARDAGSSKIQVVEIGRGVAASLVVLFHVNAYYFLTPEYWSEDALGGLFGFGHAGVEFFFVLSGFIIALIHWDDLGRPDRIRPFVEKRFVRIYPFYWLCLAGMLALLAVAPGIGSAENRLLGNILSSIALIGPEPHHGVIFVAWTLFHEILFYGLFAVALWRPRYGLPLMLVWTLACFANGILGLTEVYLLKPMNTLFLVGVGCALWLRRGTVPMPALPMLLGAALFLAVGLDEVYTGALDRFVSILGYGLGSALFLLGGVELERSRGWGAPRLAMVIGQASYSIYLTHMVVLAFSAKAMAGLGLTQSVPAPFAFVILSATAIVGGVVIHGSVERPLIELTRRRLRARRSKPAFETGS